MEQLDSQKLFDRFAFLAVAPPVAASLALTKLRELIEGRLILNDDDELCRPFLEFLLNLAFRYGVNNVHTVISLMHREVTFETYESAGRSHMYTVWFDPDDKKSIKYQLTLPRFEHSKRRVCQ